MFYKADNLDIMKINEQGPLAITKKLAIDGLNGFVSTEVQNSTSVLHISFSAKNPAHRQFSTRYGSL